MLPDDPRERVVWLQPEGPKGWEYLIARQSCHLWVVRHETYTLCACRGYGNVWKYRGRVETVRSPTVVMLMEPGEMHHTLEVPPVYAFSVVLVPAGEVTAAAHELGVSGIPHFRTLGADDPRLAAAVLRLGEVVERDDAPALERDTLQAAIVRLLLDHAERAPQPSADAHHNRAVARARSYLHAHCDAAVTLKELAAAAGVSRFWLVRAFSRTVGLPPHAYHLQVRIGRARQLLRQGIAPAFVAGELGFVDQAHFSRHFKRIMRVTPREYCQGTGRSSRLS
ncbi:helix-turn-helix domain-containing protein [Bradyrhizobium erythrophlei]|jgi:AraC-like DNA-binding protein|uniref:AraC-type DNA-binding protein n=1 Tax=Bradyrhizobium erythrophlei TaxID=1437360 RepID=A0A1M7UWX7_9BRAD|nr:AraC family transcriptional regulator [Bradyrhizobium erythrophlei]SHN87396.1 AraC-type DNA-binding protein [Bradyrhizobium erythrophlei]